MRYGSQIAVQALPQSFAYEPPYSASDAPWLATYTVQSTATSTETVTVEYSGTQISIAGIFTAGSTLTIMNTNTTTDITTETASVTVGGRRSAIRGRQIFWCIGTPSIIRSRLRFLRERSSLAIRGGPGKRVPRQRLERL